MTVKGTLIIYNTRTMSQLASVALNVYLLEGKVKLLAKLWVAPVHVDMNKLSFALCFGLCFVQLLL